MKEMYAEMNFPTDPNHWPPAKVYGSDFRKELCTMAIAVTELELWQWFRTVNPPKKLGYIWWDDENNHKITRHVLVESCGHSGATTAFAKIAIQGIAKKGFNRWAITNFPSWTNLNGDNNNSQEVGGEAAQATAATVPVSTAGLLPPVPPPPSQPFGIKISGTEDKDDMSKL